MRYNPRTESAYVTWERAVAAQRDAEMQNDLAAIRALPETACPGHCPSGCDPMGQTRYCDGRCIE